VTTAGDLNRRLVLEAPNETGDGAGGVTRVYEAVTKVWAQVLPFSARPDVRADSAGAALRYRIVIRAGPAITTRHRLRDDERVYRIVAAQKSTDRRFLEIEAEARED
jgi:SPP1 family predicted phage head-tail adaptor